MPVPETDGKARPAPDDGLDGILSMAVAMSVGLGVALSLLRSRAAGKRGAEAGEPISGLDRFAIDMAAGEKSLGGPLTARPRDPGSRQGV